MPFTVFVLVSSAAPAQVGSLGPKSLNVIDPDGLKPPPRCAVSVRFRPTTPPAEAVVDRVGASFTRVFVNVQATLPPAPSVMSAFLFTTLVVVDEPASFVQVTLVSAQWSVAPSVTW